MKRTDTNRTNRVFDLVRSLTHRKLTVKRDPSTFSAGERVRAQLAEDLTQALGVPVTVRVLPPIDFR